MSLASYEIYNINCDIPGCNEKKTFGNLEWLRGEGWETIEIFDSKFEVCPEHGADLREFFFPAQESQD